MSSQNIFKARHYVQVSKKGNNGIMITHPCNLYLPNPLLYSEIGVYRGQHYFLIFALKQIVGIV